MKVVVVGGTGLTGSKLVDALHAAGHEGVAASPSTGVNTITGEGLPDVLRHAAAVVDVTNPPSSDDADATTFFTTSTRNLLRAETEAGVAHHVVLSIVGVDRRDAPYFRAKVAQEALIRAGAIPFTILRATQFFEFIPEIADGATEGNTVRAAPVLFQPVAAGDVAAALAAISIGPPRNGIVEIAGPERFRFDELLRRHLRERDDPRTLIADPDARSFGATLEERSLVPLGDAILGATRYGDRPS